jgi:hypothetical protein
MPISVESLQVVMGILLNTGNPFKSIMSVKLVARMGKTIKITDEAHKALIELGGKSETFADVIMKLVEYYKKGHPKR